MFVPILNWSQKAFPTIALPEAPPDPWARLRPAAHNWLQPHTWVPAPSAGQSSKPSTSSSPHHSVPQNSPCAPSPQCPPCPALHMQMFPMYSRAEVVQGHPLLFSALSAAQTHKEVLSLIPLLLRAAEGRWCICTLLVVTALFSPKHRP